MNNRIRFAAVVLALWTAGIAHAALFEDEEARRAVLNLRQRVDALRQDTEKNAAERAAKDAEDSAQLRRSLLDLQTQIDLLRADVARLRGQNEQLVRDVSDLQRQQKEMQQGFDERLGRFEPLKVTVDGREFMAEQAEKRDYEAALNIFRKGDFVAAQSAFGDFVKRYPQGGYAPSAYFWLGNAQYATRDYRDAIQNFRTLLTQAPDHLRAPEAVLSIANCQVELKDSRAARRTLEDLVRLHPQSEAAQAARERLAKLR